MTARRGRRRRPTANVASRGASSKRPSLTRREAASPLRSSDTLRPPPLRAVRTRDRRRPGVNVASAPRNRTRRGPSSRRSIRIAAVRASPVETTGLTATILSSTLGGKVRSDRRRVFRSTPFPGRAATTRIDPVPTSTRPSRQAPPNRASSRSASLAAAMGASRYARSACGPSRRPTRARTRPIVPSARTSASASATSGTARSSRPFVSASAPPGATSLIGRTTRAAAARSTTARASASLIPPTSTPAMVVPRGSEPRSMSATAPIADATTTAIAPTTATTAAALRARRRGRLAVERKGPDTGASDGSGRLRACRPAWFQASTRAPSRTAPCPPRGRRSRARRARPRSRAPRGTRPIPGWRER